MALGGARRQVAGQARGPLKRPAGMAPKGRRQRNIEPVRGLVKRPAAAMTLGPRKRPACSALAASKRGKKGASSGFGGKRLHAVQIGLGTFGTVVQNLAGEPHDWDPVIYWLLKTASEVRPRYFRGVSVEPVAEHIKRLRPYSDRLPHHRLVQAAIGDEEEKRVEMSVFTEADFEAAVRQVPVDQRAAFRSDLTYLRNMSCLGEEHPNFQFCRNKALRKFGVDVHLKSQATKVWTYSRLARELDFCGCEVLMVDAEGYDAKILRSMIAHCIEQEASGRQAWPDVLVFETGGLCDHKEGATSEKQITKELEGHGYITLLYSSMNTDMVRRDALARSWRLKNWVDRLYCHACHAPAEHHVLFLEKGLCYCKTCYKVKPAGSKGFAKGSRAKARGFTKWIG